LAQILFTPFLGLYLSRSSVYFQRAEKSKGEFANKFIRQVSD